MIVEASLADSYGSAFEFTTQEWIVPHNTVDQYYQHPKWKKILPGRYTDDTHRQMALAELMLLRTHFSPKSYEWTPEEIAGSMLNVFHRDPRTGYSGRMYQLLTQYIKATEFIEALAEQKGSTFSGAAMGASVIGLYPDMSYVCDCAYEQAVLTHDSDVGVISATAAALTAHFFYHKYSRKRDLPIFLEEYCPIEGFFKNPATGDIEDISMCRRVDKVADGYIDFSPDIKPKPIHWDDPWAGEVDGTGVNCVRAAIYAIMQNDNLKDIIKQVVSFGGDTDSVAAIAVGCASLCPDIRNNIPWALYRDLEDGVYGHGYLDALDEELFKAFPRT